MSYQDRYVKIRHLESRDRFIGWNQETRTKNLHLLAYNSRFLIPDWIRVPHLASHLLGKCAKIISSDWEKLYNHPVYWLETFVDTERFKGTCYKSANWLYLGKTKGLGKMTKLKKSIVPLKQSGVTPYTVISGNYETTDNG